MNPKPLNGTLRLAGRHYELYFIPKVTITIVHVSVHNFYHHWRFKSERYEIAQHWTTILALILQAAGGRKRVIPYELREELHHLWRHLVTSIRQYHDGLDSLRSHI